MSTKTIDEAVGQTDEGQLDQPHRARIDAERALRERAEARFERLLSEVQQVEDSVSALVIALDSERRVVRWNPVAASLFGKTRDEMIGRLLSRAIDALSEKETLDRALRQAEAERQTIRIEQIGFQRPGGKHGMLGFTVNPILGAGREVTGFFVLGQDITSKLKRAQEIDQLARLEAIGRLAAGIAHELNTPIQYVGDNVRFLDDAFKTLRPAILALAEQGGSPSGSEQVDRDDLEFFLAEIPGAIEQSLEGVTRVTRIVRAMKDFSHPSREEKVHADLNKALETTLTVARAEWKYVAEVDTSFSPDLPAVPCLPGELNQVFLNLIVNAAHAITDAKSADPEREGRITISTAVTEESAVIRIGDNGCGIPPEVRDKIFEPFFTTKEVGRGTGQGLAIVLDIIRNKHRGSIDVESEPGRGTTFVLALPLNSGGNNDGAA